MAGVVLADGDLLRAVCYTKLGDQAGLMVFHYRCINLTGASAEQSDAALVLDTTFAADVKDCMSSDAVYFGFGVRRIESLPVTPELFELGSQGPGTSSPGALPSAVSGIISLKSDTIGPNANGRKFVPFPSEDDNDDTTHKPISGYMSNLNALGGIMISPLTAVGASPSDSIDLYPVIWSRDFDVRYDIKAYVARNKWATQHRRGNYGRPNVLPFE